MKMCIVEWAEERLVKEAQYNNDLLIIQGKKNMTRKDFAIPNQIEQSL